MVNGFWVVLDLFTSETHPMKQVGIRRAILLLNTDKYVLTGGVAAHGLGVILEVEVDLSYIPQHLCSLDRFLALQFVIDFLRFLIIIESPQVVLSVLL